MTKALFLSPFSCGKILVWLVCAFILEASAKLFILFKHIFFYTPFVLVTFILSIFPQYVGRWQALRIISITMQKFPISLMMDSWKSMRIMYRGPVLAAAAQGASLTCHLSEMSYQ